jgi:hypothetical protein
MKPGPDSPHRGNVVSREVIGERLRGLRLKRIGVSYGGITVPRGSACAPRMIIMSSSYEPTSAAAGHAATAAPIRPWPKPCATLAASVAAMPRPSSHLVSITIELA